jgi:hypothetical protein
MWRGEWLKREGAEVEHRYYDNSESGGSISE